MSPSWTWQAAELNEQVVEITRRIEAEREKSAS